MKVDDQLFEQRVFEKTRELIEAKGPKGWNMDQLAVAAGITKPTLYKIISTKEKLIEKVIVSHIHAMQARMVEIIDEKKDAITTLQQMVEEYATFFQNGATSYMHELLLEYPGIEQQVMRYTDEITQQLIRFIEECIDKRILRRDLDPAVVFDMLRAVVHFNVTSVIPGEHRAAKIRKMFYIVIKGILP